MLIEIPNNATRKEVHIAIFGIEPPELGSPYITNCAKFCDSCKYKDNMNCDKNWWNAPYKHRSGKEEE